MDREKAVVSLKKAQAHIGKVIKMIEQDEECLQIMQQNRAVMGLIKGAHQTIIECHLERSISDLSDSKNRAEKSEAIKNISKAINLFNK